jgi:ADP-heptose:LPS heptosyltransferase
MHSEQFQFLRSALFQLINNFNRKCEVKSILMVKQDAIGDMATCLHVFEEVKAAYPKAIITAYTKDLPSDLAEESPGVDILITSRMELQRHYDVIIDLRSDDKFWRTMTTRTFTLYYCRGLVRIKNKILGGQKHEIETNRETIKPFVKKLKGIVPRIHTLPEHVEYVDSLLKEHDIKKFAIVHTGAGDEARMWPTDRFALAADHIADKGYEIILVGSDADRERNFEVSEMMAHKSTDVVGDLQLLEFAALCAKAGFFLGNESGPMHIADRFDLPLLGLFGPGVKDVFYPVNPNAHVIHYFKKRGHTKQTVENSTIFKITADEVCQKIDEILD